MVASVAPAIWSSVAGSKPRAFRLALVADRFAVTVTFVGATPLKAPGRNATIALPGSFAASLTIAFRIVANDAWIPTLSVDPIVSGPSGARSASIRTVMLSVNRASHRVAA